MVANAPGTRIAHEKHRTGSHPDFMDISALSLFPSVSCNRFCTAEGVPQ